MQRAARSPHQAIATLPTVGRQPASANACTARPSPPGPPPVWQQPARTAAPAPNQGCNRSVRRCREPPRGSRTTRRPGASRARYRLASQPRRAPPSALRARAPGARGCSRTRPAPTAPAAPASAVTSSTTDDHHLPRRPPIPAYRIPIPHTTREPPRASTRTQPLLSVESPQRLVVHARGPALLLGDKVGDNDDLAVHYLSRNPETYCFSTP